MDIFRDRRLIFTISPGRSGSGFLSELLATAVDVRSFHEPAPKMHREYLAMITNDPYVVSRPQRRVKCDAIRAILATMAPHEIYVETSHMFIKTFFDAVLDEFDAVDVVWLRRDMASVLKSFVEMGYFSEANPNWSGWMCSPHAVTAALPLTKPLDTLDQCDRCIAYLLDMEARALRFRRDYPDVPVHETALEALNTDAGRAALFDALHLTPTAASWGFSDGTANARTSVKRVIGNPIHLATCRDRLQRYLDSLPAPLRRCAGVMT